MTLSWSAAGQCWPTAGTFRISRGARIHVEVIELAITVDGLSGRGECLPYGRYNETLAGSIDDINKALARFDRQPSRLEIKEVMPAGAARNAVDCALWDLEAKQAGKRVWDLLADETAIPPLTSAFTLSADTPQAMAENARRHLNFPVLKLKLLGGDDLDRVAMVHQAHPEADLIVDANEAWSLELFNTLPQKLAEHGVKMIEQPLPAGYDGDLRRISGIDVCADESVHDLPSLEGLEDRYSMINIKLDKAGGLTEALLMEAEARRKGLKVMTGCMLATSLAMAPAMMVARKSDYVDLDGSLLLKHDRRSAIRFDGPYMSPPSADLWG